MEKLLEPVKVRSKSQLSLLSRLRQMMSEARGTFRQDGLKGVVRRYGWRVFAVFFVYYLTRDLILYVALPWLFAHHLAS